MGTAARSKHRTHGYRQPKPHGMKAGEFITRTNRIKRIEQEIERRDALDRDETTIAYPCEVTGKKKHTFTRWFKHSPRGHLRPLDKSKRQPTENGVTKCASQKFPRPQRVSGE